MCKPQNRSGYCAKDKTGYVDNMPVFMALYEKCKVLCRRLISKFFVKTSIKVSGKDWQYNVHAYGCKCCSVDCYEIPTYTG